MARLPHLGALCAGAAVLALTAFGALMLATIIEWGWVAVGIVVVAMIPATASALRAPQWLIRGTIVLPAVVVPLLGLLALDVIWAAAGLEQPAPDWGLGIAGCFVAGIAYTYLRWVGAPPPNHVLPWIVLAAASALLIDGLIRGGLPQVELWLVAGATGVAVAVYLVNEDAGDIEHPLWWAVLTVVTLVVFLPLLYDAIHGHRIKGVLLVGGAIAAGFVGLNAIALSRRPVGGAKALQIAGLILAIALVPLGVWGFVTATDRPHEESQPVPVPAAAPARPVPQYALDHRPGAEVRQRRAAAHAAGCRRVAAHGNRRVMPRGHGTSRRLLDAEQRGRSAQRSRQPALQPAGRRARHADNDLRARSRRPRIARRMSTSTTGGTCPTTRPTRHRGRCAAPDW